jgi:release factor glutamine methyltransferase
MTGPRTIGALLHLGERVLTDSSHIFDDHDNRDAAQELLAHCTGVAKGDLDPEQVLPPRMRERYLSLVARRAAGEPLPLLTGHIEFYGLDLKVRPGPFVPRPSSELLVVRMARRLRRRRNPIVVDICTGQGPIALAIADEFPAAEVWGTDIDSKGLVQARRNARDLGLYNVVFRRGDMYGALPSRLQGTVDVVAGHVPYVPAEEVADLPTEVKEYEPVYALTGDTDEHLGLLPRAIGEAPKWLEPGGWLLLEMSEDIASPARRMCRKAGLEDAGVATDEDRLSVVVEARRPG